MDYASRKNKLPKTHSYPLKKGDFDLVFAETNIPEAMISELYFHEMQYVHLLVGIHYKGRKQSQFARPGTMNIEVCSVNRADRNAARTALLAQAMPRLKSWLESLLQDVHKLDHGSGIYFWWENGALVFKPTKGYSENGS